MKQRNYVQMIFVRGAICLKQLLLAEGIVEEYFMCLHCKNFAYFFPLNNFFALINFVHNFFTSILSID